MLLLNYCHFYVKTATPLRKVTPSFPAGSFKSWDPVTPSLFRIYGRRFNSSPFSRGEACTICIFLLKSSLLKISLTVFVLRISQTLFSPEKVFYGITQWKEKNEPEVSCYMMTRNLVLKPSFPHIGTYCCNIMLHLLFQLHLWHTRNNNFKSTILHQALNG